MNELPRFIVDRIIPTRALHVIYGPSGAGRSTLLRQMVKEISRGEPVLGHPSHLLPFVLMSTVDAPHELQADLIDLGCDPSQIPHGSMLRGHTREAHTIDGLIKRARVINPHLQLLFIDGMTSLCNANIMIYRECATFLVEIRDICLAQNLTIIGTTSCGKSDDANAQHKPLGSVAWNDHTGTRFILDYAKPGKFDDPDRTLQIIPRSSHQQFGRYTLDHTTHLLLPNESANRGLQNELDEWLSHQQPGAEFSKMNIEVAGKQLGVGRTITLQWLSDCVELGMLIKIRHGFYTRPAPPTPQEIQ